MPARQTFDFGERIIHSLRVKPASTLKKGVLVAEIAMLGAAARHDNRIGHQVIAPLDQIASNARHAFEGPACGGDVSSFRLARPKILQEFGESLLPRPQKDGI